MARLNPPLGSAPSRSKPLSVQRVVNMMAQKAPEGGKVPFILMGCPGLKTRYTLPKAPVRGFALFKDELYGLGGDTLYKIAANGTITAIGGAAINNSGYAYIAPGKGYIVIVSGGKGYYTDGTAVTEIDDPDFPGAAWVTYTDGYWIFGKPGEDQWFISDLLAPWKFDALDFASAESAPDPILRGLVTHRELWLFGKGSTEIWTNTGAAAFPFERYNSASIDRGIMSAASAANLDNTTFWVGEDGIVYRADGYTPSRISTHEVEKAVADCTDQANIQGFTWTQEGHVFYALRLPGAGCWVYDAATQVWHERETFGRAIWRAASYAHAYGKHFVGDDTTGGIYELDWSTYTDGDDVFAREVYSPPIWAEDARFITHRLQADYEVGVGLTTGQGSDPQAMLQWSDDGGHVWSSEHWRSLGPIGARYQRVIWRRLGMARQRSYRLKITDPVKVNFMGWTIDAGGAAV